MIKNKIKHLLTIIRLSIINKLLKENERIVHSDNIFQVNNNSYDKKIIKLTVQKDLNWYSAYNNINNDELYKICESQMVNQLSKEIINYCNIEMLDNDWNKERKIMRATINIVK